MQFGPEISVSRMKRAIREAKGKVEAPSLRPVEDVVKMYLDWAIKHNRRKIHVFSASEGKAMRKIYDQVAASGWFTVVVVKEDG
jgi:hypothetical protein